MAGPSSTPGHRYLALAAQLEQGLRTGAIPAGSRLPSVRALGRTWGVSLTTAVAAYRELERAGLVEVRPQAGHYARPPDALPLPAEPRPAPTTVDIGQLALLVMRAAGDAGLAPFGPAMPDPALLPSRDLARILAALAREGAGLDAYGVPPGLAAARQAVARRAAAIGCPLPAEAVVTTAGGLEALTLALRATCRPGQVVAIESPMYYGLLQSVEALDLRVLEIPREAAGGMALEVLREALDEHAVAAVVALPAGGNPHGARSGTAHARELVALLAGRRIPLIEDDVLGDLALDGARQPPAKAFDRDGLVLWCSSLSKTAAPGLRFGWIAAGRYQAAVEHLQFTNAVGPSPLAQLAGARLLAGGLYERVLRRARAAYAERTAAMAVAAREAFPPGTRVEEPAAGFCLWVELPPACDGEAVLAQALRQGISLVPGRLFSAKPRYRHCIRLCAARWDGSMRPAIRRLARIVAILAQG